MGEQMGSYEVDSEYRCLLEDRLKNSSVVMAGEVPRVRAEGLRV